MRGPRIATTLGLVSGVAAFTATAVLALTRHGDVPSRRVDGIGCTAAYVVPAHTLVPKSR
jgi:hypothetical protein